MDIAIVHPYLDFFGGAERVIVAIVNSIPKNHSVSLYSMKFSKKFTKELKRPVELCSLSSNRIIESKKLPVTRFWTTRAILNSFFHRIKNIEADIVNYHNFPSFFLTKPLCQDTKQIWMCQEPIAEEFLLPNLKNPKNFQLPIKAFIRLIRIFERRKILEFNDVYVNSQKMRLLLGEIYRIKAKIFPMPINEKFMRNRHMNFKKEYNSFIVVNGTAYRKGFFDFTYSQTFRNFLIRNKARICCEGPIYDNNLLRSITEKFNDLVYFSGRVNDIGKLYEQSEFVLITNYKEPFGLSAIEAVCYGSIPIVPKTSGVSFLVEKYKCGVSFKSRNDFYKKFEALDLEKREYLRENGKKMLDLFTQQNFKESVLRMFYLK